MFLISLLFLFLLFFWGGWGESVLTYHLAQLAQMSTGEKVGIHVQPMVSHLSSWNVFSLEEVEAKHVNYVSVADVAHLTKVL